MSEKDKANEQLQQAFVQEAEKSVKMVIVMRADLDQMDLASGKACSQSAHAAVNAAIDCYEHDKEMWRLWTAQRFVKVVVKVNSEEELKELCRRAEAKGIPVAPIVDAGKTKFPEPTLTCAAFGPDSEKRINSITGSLELY